MADVAVAAMEPFDTIVNVHWASKYFVFIFKYSDGQEPIVVINDPNLNVAAKAVITEKKLDLGDVYDLGNDKRGAKLKPSGVHYYHHGFIVHLKAQTKNTAIRVALRGRPKTYAIVYQDTVKKSPQLIDTSTQYIPAIKHAPSDSQSSLTDPNKNPFLVYDSEQKSLLWFYYTSTPASIGVCTDRAARRCNYGTTKASMMGGVVPDAKSHPSKKLPAIDRSAQWTWQGGTNQVGQFYPILQKETEQKDFMQNQGATPTGWGKVTVIERAPDQPGKYRTQDFEFSFLMPVWWIPNARPPGGQVVTQHYQWVHTHTVWRDLSPLPGFPMPDADLNHLAIFTWPYPYPYFKIVVQTDSGAINVEGWGHLFVPWDPGSGGAFNPPVPGGVVSIQQLSEGPETKKWTGIEYWPDDDTTDFEYGNAEQELKAAPAPTKMYELKKWSKVIYQLWNGKVRFSKKPERKNQIWIEPDVDDKDPHAQAKKDKIFMLDPESTDPKPKGGRPLIFIPNVRDKDFVLDLTRKGKPLPNIPPLDRDDDDKSPGAEDKSPDEKPKGA
jgi:hypothetical protein